MTIFLSNKKHFSTVNKKMAPLFQLQAMHCILNLRQNSARKISSCKKIIFSWNRHSIIVYNFYSLTVHPLNLHYILSIYFRKYFVFALVVGKITFVFCIIKLVEISKHIFIFVLFCANAPKKCHYHIKDTDRSKCFALLNAIIMQLK